MIHKLSTDTTFWETGARAVFKIILYFTTVCEDCACTAYQWLRFRDAIMCLNIGVLCNSRCLLTHCLVSAVKFQFQKASHRSCVTSDVWGWESLKQCFLHIFVTDCGDWMIIIRQLEKTLIETLVSCTEDLHKKRAWRWLHSNSKI